jgi:hypothetical protein
MSIFGFKKKKGEIVNHWISFVDNFSFSPSEFYEQVEEELKERCIPQMDVTRVDFLEGGLLSQKRVYLRMIRERMIFDTCAAPFGKTFFFSCRSVYIPPIITIWDGLIIIVVLNLTLGSCVRILGPEYGTIAFIGLLFALIGVFRNTVSMGLRDLDSIINKTPIAGALYERFFRKQTYHRLDSRLCYLHIIPSVVKELAEEFAATKGLKLIHQYEMSPVLGDLYHRAEVSESTEMPMPEPPPRVSI